MKFLAPAIFLVAILVPFSVHAETPLAVRRSVVKVICENRQGTGVILNTAKGYVLTNAHVAMNVETKSLASSCTIGFMTDESLKTKAYYRANIIKSQFDELHEQDYAILKLTSERVGGTEFTDYTNVKVNEFPTLGGAVTAYGFSSDSLLNWNGTLQSFSRGIMSTSSNFMPGASGGPIFDSQGNLIGISTRIVTETDTTSGAVLSVDHQAIDILNIIQWLDRDQSKAHDEYLQHADSVRYDSLPYVIRDEAAPCQYFVRTEFSSAVYCLMPENRRLVFSNLSTYNSWANGSREVLYVSVSDISKYRLAGHVTYKAGSLVKVTTDPTVYFVADSVGTLRAIPSEERATQLFGSDWNKKVKDIPDAFFVNYSVGIPLSP